MTSEIRAALRSFPGRAFSVTLYGIDQRRDAALLARPSRRAPEKLEDVPHSLHASGLPIVEPLTMRRAGFRYG
ncbi:MAG TPA: hypothetical protein VML95_00890 [Longimicrobiales bacterium]|nr:hypothetical protein [Longimicrobiales bacterium]